VNGEELALRKFHEKLADKVRQLELEFAESQAQFEAKKSEYTEAFTELLSFEAILVRHGIREEQKRQDSPAVTVTKNQARAENQDHLGSIDVEQELTRKQGGKAFRVLSDDAIMSADRNAQRLLKTEPKSSVLYIIALFIIQESGSRKLSPRALLDNLPMSLRLLYHSDPKLAAENLRGQLRKHSRPLDSASKLRYNGGSFEVA
jgi:hypothetical protein